MSNSSSGPSYADRVALVTGGATGIGAQIVKRLAAAGAIGVVCDIKPPASESLPEGWVAAEVDVTSEPSVAAAVDTAAGSLGHIDVTVAAAGIVPTWQKVTELDFDDWDNMFAVNARGVAAVIKHAAPKMTEGGAIVAIASMNAWRGDPNLSGYVASKHAVLGFVRSAALDLGPRGIRVNAVGPGPTATDALLSRIRGREAAGGPPVAKILEAMASETALRRIATADDIASAVLFLGSQLANGMTGQLLSVDGGVL